MMNTALMFLPPGPGHHPNLPSAQRSASLPVVKQHRADQLLLSVVLDGEDLFVFKETVNSIHSSAPKTFVWQQVN